MCMHPLNLHNWCILIKQQLFNFDLKHEQITFFVRVMPIVDETMMQVCINGNLVMSELLLERKPNILYHICNTLSVTDYQVLLHV